jgi:hypothetical protein
MVMFPTEQAHLPIKGWAVRPPWGEVGIAEGASASGEKIEKPSTFVQLSPIKGLSEGHNSFDPCGKTRRNPTYRLMSRKSIFGP